MDLKDSAFVGRSLLYVLLGTLDAAWQTFAYWIMGAMSNDPSKLAFFTGFYKSIQSAGGATAWGLDADHKPYMDIFVSTWVLLTAGLVFMLPMIHMRVKEHTAESM